ncbi:nonribosomal peptide synthase GliP-like protein [Apiospora marii]|uniref:nonribosomal peptide synthase GliP-like protein n=1 Tax=Apiospora marii TaxID=335849 RepID=UPI003131DF8C
MDIQDTINRELCSVLKLSPWDLDHEASFPALGGNSLSAVKLASQCRKDGVELQVNSILRSKSLSELIDSASHSDCRTAISQETVLPSIDYPRQDTWAWLDRSEAAGIDFRIDLYQPPSDKSSSTRSSVGVYSSPNTSPSISPAQSGPSSFPASELQMSLIHGSIRNPGTNIIRHFETYEPKDIPVVRAAWQVLFHQEPILRTHHLLGLSPQEDAEFDWTELQTEDSREFHQRVDEPLNSTELSSSWEVVTLALRGRPVKSVVMWTIHHALIDGYSAQLLITKLRKITAGQCVTPGPSAAGILSRLQGLREERRLEGDAFWDQKRELHSQAATALSLPSPIEPLEENRFGERAFQLEVDYLTLDGIAKQCNVTLATIHYAAWALVMAFLASNDNVIFGIALSGRNLPFPGMDEAIGPFVNTLPLAISTRPDMTLKQLASHVFEQISELSEYQWTTTDNGFVRNFQTAMNMQFDLYLADEVPGSVHPMERPSSKQANDIPLSILVDAQEVSLHYNLKDFQPGHMYLVARLYGDAVKSFLRLDTTLDVAQSRMMRPEDHEFVRRHGNCFSKLTQPLAISEDLVTLFENIVGKQRDALAVERGDIALTYDELDQRANIVASELARHVKPEDVVCVDADRSIAWIVSIFGILKAGATYCAIDSELPSHLRDVLFDKAGAKVFLFDRPEKESPARIPSSCQVALSVESLVADAKRCHDGPHRYPRRSRALPSTPAYVCFTSGSTGTPKGVVCLHEGLVAFQRDLEVRLFAQPGTKVSQVMSPAFDGSIHEIFSALCHGAALILPAEGNVVFQALERADSAILTPSVADALDPDDYPALKYVYLVGEPVKQSVCDRWGAAKQLYNMYGPTEGTCGATIKRLLPGEAVNIGRPNPTTRVYIMDSKDRLVPPGVIGEMMLAGVQVARGYLGMPALTKERFLPDHRCPGLNEHAYKTGDRAYWLPNGEIMCLGRNDRQVKLRGFRLDLNDLEIRIAQALPELRAVAIASSSDFLVAVIQPSTVEVGKVTATIAKVLPAYAQPRHIVLVDKFPATRAGKLDYKEMVSDDFIRHSSDKGEIRTPLEAKIASIWRQLLKLKKTDRIGSKSNFLQLGGNSVLQMALLARLSSTLHVKIPLKVVIESQSLGELSAQLELFLQEATRPAVQRNLALGRERVSPIEQEWWAKYRISHNNASAFNVSFVADFEPGSIHPRAFSRSWNAVMARYPILRSRYSDESMVNKPFDLAHEPPIRVSISSERLALVMSHIVADLTTLRVILEEVKSEYEGGTLPPVRYRYEDSTIWEEEAPMCNLHFWSTYLEGHEELHWSSPLPERTSYQGTSKVYQLPDQLAARMLRFEAVSLQQLAVAAVGLVLQAETDETDIIIGTPFMNRSSDADMETVGLFLEPLPVRVRHYPGTDDVDDAGQFLRGVRRSADSALAHAVPWHKLLEHLGITPQYPRQPLFDVMVTFHHPDNAVKLGLPGVRQRHTWAEGSKFSLMTEFTASERGTVTLRVEHDDTQHSGDSVDRLVTRITTALSMLVEDNASCTAIKRTIRGSHQGGGVVTAAPRNDMFASFLDLA